MNCIKCGKEITENSTFCSVCGAKQVKTYKEVFTRGQLSDKEFIANINKWFQWHPKITNVQANLDTGNAPGIFVNQKRLDELVIEYELSEEDNPYQYGLVKEREFDLIQQNLKSYMAQWQKKHPQVEVLNWSGGTNSRGSRTSLMFGGIGAMNKLTVYILIRFRRNQNQGIPAGETVTPTEMFCPACGKKLNTRGAFCPYCGNKLNG